MQAGGYTVELDGKAEGVWAVVLSEDGTKLLVGAGSVLQLWDLEDWLLVGEEENLGELDEERLEAVKAALEEEGIEAAPNSSLGKLQGDIHEEESQFPIRFLVGGRARANGCEVLGCLGGEVILLQQMATENLK